MTLSENTIIEIEYVLNDLRNFTYKHETICFGLQLDPNDDLGQKVGKIIAQENVSNYTMINQLKRLKLTTTENS